ncbi:MAG: GntR family transcriptional regulator [Firmicutes bacterium]|nr:GntR family transcriptional regulator [Bacillota bacterium]
MSRLMLLKHEKPRFTTKTEVVYRALREHIVNGDLEPGTRLLQKKIAEELGVSEIPVREAIRQLQAEGLVVVTPHSGAEVASFRPEEIEEALAIRGVLEGFAARTAVGRAAPGAIAELRSILDNMGRCVENDDRANYGILNHEFHTKLYALSPYPKLQKMIEEIWYGAERSRSVFKLAPERLRPSHQEHLAILEALEKGEEERVEELVRLHRSNASRSLLDSVNKKG